VKFLKNKRRAKYFLRV